MRFKPVYIAASAFAAACLLALPARAQPSGSAVVFGTASVSAPNANTTLINQASSTAIINWQNFSIAAGSSVVFAQPGAAAIALNRVLGGGSSQIFGTLQANGHVWIINANGVLFGQGSQINVGGLLATTSDIADSDFAAGRYDFNKPSPNTSASVDNDGTIRTAPGGSAVLSGPHVANSGLIQADAGRIVLGGADTFTVDFDGDNLLRYQITTPVSNTPVDPNGVARKEIVSNSGTLAAAGGTILMTARAAANVADNVVNNTGMISATSAKVRNGEVILDAGDGTVADSGTINSTGNGTGQTGGNVTLAGSTVNVADNARIDASGDQGGGTIAIGGGLHGSGAYTAARNTTIGNAVIRADANTNGDGGTISIWSSGHTIFSGSASARGGSVSGNGGQVETSGNTLYVDTGAIVDTSAPNGAEGVWLLDPDFLNIVNDPTIPNPLVGGVLSYGNSASSVPTQAIVRALQGPLGSGGGSNVTLQAVYDITVTGAIDAHLSSHTLTLDAGRSIVLNANINMLGSGGSLVLSAKDPTAPAGDHSGATISGSGVLSADNIELLMGSGGGDIGSAGASIQIGGGRVSVTTSGANAYIQSTNAVTGLTLGTSDLGSGSLFANSPGALTFAAGSTTAGSVTATAAGDINIESGAAIAASSDGNAIVLSDGGLFNNGAGATPFSLSGGGRWLVYSQDPASEIFGGLSYDFRQYNASYPTAPTPANGNGFLYTAAPTISLSLTGDATKTYDGTSAATLTGGNFSMSGVIGGDTVSVINIPAASYDTPNVGINKTITVSGLSTSNLSATNGSVTVYGYRLESGAASGDIGTITAATLTYVANAANRTYGAANPALSGMVIGFVNGETVETATRGSLIFTTAADVFSNVGSYAINGSGLTANNGNYVFVQAAGNATALTINPALLTVTPNAVSPVYNGLSLDNGAYSDNTANYSITGFQNSQTIASAGVALSGSMAFNGSTSTLVRNVAAYSQAVGSLALSSTNNNYAMAFSNPLPNNYVITAATLTYTSDAANRTYGAENPLFSGTVSGFVGSDNLANATGGSAVFTSPATAASNVGSYAINGTGLSANNGNYVFVQAAGNAMALTINPATLTVRPNAVSTVYNALTLNNTAYSDNTANYSITGLQNSQTIASAGITLSGSLAFNDSTATAVRNVGTYTQDIGTLVLTSAHNNYVMSFANPVPNNYAITAATLTYNAAAANRTYGAANPALSGTVTGFAGGDTVGNSTTGSAIFSTAATSASNVGHYAINGTGLTANNGNYVFVQAAGNATALTINPATLTYVANPANRPFGAANPPFSGTVTGFVNGEGMAVLTGTMTFTSAATFASAPGSYAINGTGLSANNGNYTFIQAGANATALTITAPTGTPPLVLPWLFGGFGDRPTDSDSLLFAFTTSDAAVDDFVVVAGQGSPQLPGADGGTNSGPIASLTVDGNGYLEPPTSADQLSGSLSHYFQNGSLFDGNYSSWGNEALWY